MSMLNKLDIVKATKPLRDVVVPEETEGTIINVEPTLDKRHTYKVRFENGIVLDVDEGEIRKGQ